MKNNPKEPTTKGVVKVPVIMQLEALECGAACLTMILAYYGKWVPLEQIRSDCGVSRDGSNAKNIMRAGRHYDMEVKAFRYEPQYLKENGSFPCIIHWNFNHFVVCDGFKGDKVYLNDPAKGAYSVSMEEFDRSFTGICMFFRPGENFEATGKPKSVLSFAAKRLEGSGQALLFALLMGSIAALMAAISPAFSLVFLDRLLPGKNPGWVMPFFIMLLLFNVIRVVMTFFQSIYSLRINGKMAAVGNATYMWKVLHLPIEFFSQRMAGDIQQRQTTNAMIANTLITTLAPLGINGIMMIFYLVIILRYSVILSLVGIISYTLNAVVSRYISKKRTNITRIAMRDGAKLASTTVSGIQMVETIKSSGAEKGFFNKWSGYQASVNNIQVSFTRNNIFLEMIPALISNISNYAVLILGVWLTMRGEFTVGMVMAFQGFLSSFMAPALSFVSAGQQIQEMRTSMERIEDVMEYPSPAVFAPETEETSYEKLGGNVELNHVKFGYSSLGDPVVSDFSMKLEPGKSVAIIGGSGSGKSTMSKLIAGLYQPWEGEILFDGKKMDQINKRVFYGSLAVVDQDIILFEDSIANNIKMWDESIEDFEMILAARDAQIHDDIMKRPEGYQHKLLEGGKDFSGGQRQRIEIARVLAQDPTIIILDEATSALDAKTEYEVVKAIRQRGISCIVIAHRLSTIRSCDEIIVMKKGEIVDRGTHSELMQNSEMYRELVLAE